MLIPLPFHGQSSREDVEAVLSDPSILASTGKYPLGQNKSLFNPESFEGVLCSACLPRVMGGISGTEIC